MSTPRLPVPGSDDGNWGDLLNDFLTQSHNADGSLKPSAVTTAGGGTAGALADGSIITAKLADGAVAGAKLADGVVTNAKLDNATQSAITSISGKYTKPSPGIPATDLANAVQTSLGKADSALQSAPVSSVAGKTGVVTLAKADIGLGNVDNTADTDKPVSIATQTALNTKANSSDTRFTGSPAGTAGASLSATDASVTNSRTPNGSASGDLSGTYPAPTVAKINGVSLPSSAPVNGNVLTATSASATVWTTPAAGVSLDTTAADITPLGSQAAGSTGKAADAGHVHAMPRLDQINAPTSAVLLNAQKISGLANGTAATDAAAFGQLPIAGTTASTYAAGNDTRITGATQKASNLSDLASAPTARINLGLATVAASGLYSDLAGRPTVPATLAIGSVTTIAGALTINQLTPVDATAGTVTMTLPTGQAAGTLIGVRKHDTTTNTVTITGTIAGTASTTHTLALPAETLEYQTDNAGSWWVTAGNKTLSALDARYPLNTATPAGDLAGTYSTPSVARIKGVTISATAPSSGQVLTASSSTAASWVTPSTAVGSPEAAQFSVGYSYAGVLRAVPVNATTTLNAMVMMRIVSARTILAGTLFTASFYASATTAGGLFRPVLYKLSKVDLSLTLVADFGQVDMSTGFPGVKAIANIASLVDINANDWLAVGGVNQGSTTATLQVVTGTPDVILPGTPAGSVRSAGITVTAVTGAAPSTPTPAIATQGTSFPLIYMMAQS